MNDFKKNTKSFENLIDIIKTLRGPDGCPWDQKQTHQSLSPYLIEEAHEVIEAIDKKKTKYICEELGDVLLQIILHTSIAEDSNEFTMKDVIQGISEKMIRRHPHIFLDFKASNIEEVQDNWQKIKEKEKSSSNSKASFNLPLNLPSLIKSQKIGEKTKSFKFDWKNHKGALKKVDEELKELKEAICNKKDSEILHELGDLLFSVSQVARHLNLDADSALRQANNRFEKRFFSMIDNKSLEEFSKLTDNQKEKLWIKVKQNEQKKES